MRRYMCYRDDDLNTYQVVQWCIGKKGAYILKVRLLYDYYSTINTGKYTLITDECTCTLYVS